MLAYRKWVLSLGIAATAPGIAMAGPFTLFKSDRPAQSSAAKSNEQLAQEVAANLRAEKLSGFDIEIEVQNGTCLLVGRIADADQKARATTAARRVEGIRAVDNKLELLNRGPAQSASQIAQVSGQAESPFSSSPAFAQANYEVPASAGSGIQTADANEPAEAGSGIQQTGFFSRNYSNNQSSGYSGSSGSSDIELANTIAMAVAQSGMRGHDIDLQVRHGVAILQGKVGSPQDVDQVTRIVSSVPGVRQVDNRLAAPGMRPAGPAPSQNQMVAEQIAQALAYNQLNGQNIEVRYNNGIATLNGSVTHPQMKMAAAQIVQGVPGVQQIDDRLQVIGGPAGPQGHPVQQVAYQGGPQGLPPGMHPAMMAGAPGMMNGGPMMGPGGQMMGPGGQMMHGGSGQHMAYDLPNLPNYSWPTYAPYPNSAAITYPQEYSASAWPYIGPFYPYPQVPLGWRQVQLEWDDGYWNLNFRPRTDKWFWYFDPKNW